jgi:hypothetical protein
MNAPFQAPTYPVVQFLVSRGKTLSWALSALVLLGALGLSLASATPWPLVIGAAGAVVLLGLLLSYVEVLRIIADTLLPKY